MDLADGSIVASPDILELPRVDVDRLVSGVEMPAGVRFRRRKPDAFDQLFLHRLGHEAHQHR